MSQENNNMHCSFCGSHAKEVKKLIAGPNDVYICDACINICHDILDGKASLDKDTEFVKNESTVSFSPRELYEHLNQYVIGQDDAKMAMSVAVYNHYKRLNNPVVDDVELSKANCLLAGNSGVGKCCSHDTMVKIKISEEIYNRIFSTTHMNKMIECEVSIGEIFDVISEIEAHQFVNDEEYFQKSNIQMRDENNEWKNVSGLITKTDNKVCVLTWSDNSKTRCAAKHRIRVNEYNCKLADEFVIGDEIVRYDGIILICMNNEIINTDEIFYDLQIDTPSHLYQTSNGILHHNTLIAQTIARKIDVPFTIADATTLTESGYVGADTDSIISNLLQAANFDVSKAERGIVFIDEIDKKRSRGESGAGTRDVSGEGVQQALLKMLEGTDVYVPPPGGRKGGNVELIKVNTTNILFIVTGAFVGLDKVIEREVNKGSGMGFTAQTVGKTKMSAGELMKKIEPDHLIKFGMIPELVGRLPVVIVLDDLDEHQLVRVLTEPKNAVIKQFSGMFKLDGIDLQFTPDALTTIASDAIKRKVGARGLRSVIEKHLMKLQFELPELLARGIDKVIINAGVISGENEPELIAKQ